MSLALTTFAVAIASALLPFVNIELYLASVGAVGVGAGVGLSLAAATGQTVGKVIWWDIARRGIDSPWVQRKLSSPKMKARLERWTVKMQGRPWYAGALILVSAAGGIPPLLVMAVVAGALRMPLWVFVPTVFVGRFLRFYAILVGVDVLLH